MLISTRGRYALRVMADLAAHDDGDYIVLMDIARRQEISEKYLESILAVLSKADFVLAARGRGGGYRLSRAPEDYTVGSILRLTEGSLSPVACLRNGADGCSRAADCPTLPVWEELDGIIERYLDGVTLRDLMHNGENNSPKG